LSLVEDNAKSHSSLYFDDEATCDSSISGENNSYCLSPVQDKKKIRRGRRNISKRRRNNNRSNNSKTCNNYEINVPVVSRWGTNLSNRQDTSFLRQPTRASQTAYDYDDDNNELCELLITIATSATTKNEHRNRVDKTLSLGSVKSLTMNTLPRRRISRPISENIKALEEDNDN